MQPSSLNIAKAFAKDTKEILKDNLIVEYLFGSYARGQQTEFSDIDILIIVKQLNVQLRGSISGLSSDYSLEKGVLISPVIKDINVWKKNEQYKTLFYTEIQRDGIKL